MFGSDRIMTSAVRHVAMVCSMTFFAASAWAQSPSAAADENVRRLRMQVRQLQQEQTTLQEARSKAEAERTALQQEIESLKADLARQKASSGVASNKAAVLTRDIATAKAEKDTLAERLNETEKALRSSSDLYATCQRDLGSTRRDMGAANQELSEANARLGSRLKQCSTFNGELHAIGTDLLQRYENKGFGEVLGTTEPFIQKARVRLENLSEEIRGKLEARRLPAEQN